MDAIQGQLKTRSPRILISPLQGLTFRVGSALIPVLNLSTSGIGLAGSDFEKAPKSGQSIEGFLEFEGKSFVVQIEIIHSSPQILGGSFKAVSPSLQESIQEYFQAELSALSMRQVDPKNFKKDPDGTAIWFHGHTSELYYVVKEKEILRFRISFLGNQITAKQGMPIKSGQIILDHDLEDPRMKLAERVVMQSKILKPMTDAAIRFLSNVRGLDTHHADSIRDWLKREAQ